MIKRLVSVGNSKALLLDKPLMELLNITDEVKIETDGKSLIVTAVVTRPDVRAAHKQVMKRHAGAFRKLAK